VWPFRAAGGDFWRNYFIQIKIFDSPGSNFFKIIQPNKSKLIK